jgi:RNA polymerase sigma factor (sigma-70 family)
VFTLTEDEERALILRAREAADPGDRLAARNALVLAHKGLAVSVAERFRRCGLDFEDMVQCGCVGLITAADRFDPARPNPFKAYAGFWIRREITLALRRRRRAGGTCDPADPAGVGDPAAPEPDPPAYLPDEIEAVAAAALRAGLSDRERRFFEHRFRSGGTREEAARTLGVSTEGARLIEIRVLDKLRAAMGQPVPVRVTRRDRAREKAVAAAGAARATGPPGVQAPDPDVRPGDGGGLAVIAVVADHQVRRQAGGRRGPRRARP